MKKLLLLLLIVPVLGFGQEPEFKFENNLMVVVFQTDSLSANEAQSKATAAIANMYNSAQNVIQLNDSESNKLIIKALTEVLFDNPLKAAYPKNKYFPSKYIALVDYSINLDFKDGRYRLVFELLSSKYKDLAMRSSSPNGTMFNVSFFPLNDDASARETLEAGAKAGMMGKKRTENYINGYFNARNDWHKDLMSKAKSLAMMINDGISNSPSLKGNSILNDDF